MKTEMYEAHNKVNKYLRHIFENMYRELYNYRFEGIEFHKYNNKWSCIVRFAMTEMREGIAETPELALLDVYEKIMKVTDETRTIRSTQAK